MAVIHKKTLCIICTDPGDHSGRSVFHRLDGVFQNSWIPRDLETILSRIQVIY